jgi:drug/metabolite transporter (DMT)-like permease
MGDRREKCNLLIAFAAVYILWGSTYLAIRYAVETIPPLAVAGVRFGVSGFLFWGWAILRRAPRATPIQWRWAALTGALMLGVGGGAVHWAEQYVPSGLTALIATAVPIFIVLIDWLRPGGSRPGWPVMLGILVGFGGIYLLIGARDVIADPAGYLSGTIVLLAGAIVWSAGSIISRYADEPRSPSVSTAIKLWAGGAVLFIVGTASGEWNQVHFGDISLTSVVALAYLMVFGSLAFAAYNWLLKNTTPARAATYAYVNPVVAVLLGVLMAGEPFTPRIALAMAVIIGAVMIIVNYRARATGAQPDQIASKGDETRAADPANCKAA